MKHNLSIGLLGECGSLETILFQSGIPHQRCSTISQLTSSDLKMVACFDYDQLLELRRSTDQIAIITNHSVCAKLFGLESNRVKATAYCVSEPVDSQFAGFRCRATLSTLSKKGTGFAFGENCEKISDSSVCIFKQGRTIVLSFPFDFLDQHIGEIPWNYEAIYSPFVDKFYYEVAPAVAWGELRKLIVQNIAKLYSKLKLPFVYLSPKMSGGPYFCYRVDADGYSKNSTEQVLNLFSRHDIRASWYIDLLGWAGNHSELDRLRSGNQDVQVHCYRHVTYDSYKTNYVNLKKGKSILNGLGFMVSGIVSPFGHYSNALQQAVDDLGFCYSSEFGYDVDNLPSWPGNNRNSALQIPIHTASIGACYNAGWAADDFFAHILSIVKAKAEENGVAILYDHPLNRMENEIGNLDHLFSELKNSGINPLSIAEFVDIWQRRQIGEAWYNEHTKSVTFDCNDNDFAVIIISVDNVRANNENYQIGMLDDLPSIDRLKLQTDTDSDLIESSIFKTSKEAQNRVWQWYLRNMFTYSKQVVRRKLR